MVVCEFCGARIKDKYYEIGPTTVYLIHPSTGEHIQLIELSDATLGQYFLCEDCSRRLVRAVLELKESIRNGDSITTS